MSDNVRDTDNDWKYLGEKDPYWAVISQEDFRIDKMDKAKFAEFISSGEDFVGNLFGLINHHLIPDFFPKRALDFGCGVGRVVIPLAKFISEVVGMDISPAMLKLCKKNALEYGLTNIIFCESDDHLTKITGEFDFINTYIVLQHIPPVRGYIIIKELIKHLSIGGVGSIQLTYAKSRRFFIHEQNRASYYRREGDMLYDIMKTEHQPSVGTITMFDYDLNQVFAIISAVAGHPLLVLPTDHDDHLGQHIVFVKARNI